MTGPFTVIGMTTSARIVVGIFLVVSEASAAVSSPSVTTVAPASSPRAILQIVISGSGFVGSGTYPAGTVAAGGHGYLFSSTALSWDAAESACEALGGTLATATSAGENATISGTWTANPYDGFWIGMNDVATPGVWTWITGEPTTYFAWAPSEPNNAGLEFHVQVYRAFGLDGQWNNLQGSQARPYVCEFHGAGPVAPAVRLVGPATIAPTSAILLGTGRILCTFDLMTAGGGVYDVRVTNADGGTATLAAGFAIDAPSTPVAGPVRVEDGPRHRLRFGGIGGTGRCGTGAGIAAAAGLVIALIRRKA